MGFHHMQMDRLFSFYTLLILLSFLGLASASAVTPASCHPDQRSALLQLKDGFIDPSLSSWQPRTDCCHGWEGVTCDESSGHVISLDLSNYDIEGNLSVAIFNLTSLQHLNLAYNNFLNNRIPDGFEKLTELAHLNLSNSNFAGQIPIGLANLTNLISLDLSINWNLSLHNPSLRTLIGNLSNLRELHLNLVDISDNGTEWCRALSESVPLLQVLSMIECNLSGPFDPSLSQLHFLTKIDLSLNNFQSSVPDYFSDFSLTSLQFSSSNLMGSFPCKIFQIPTLTFLDISSNEELTVATLPNFPLGSSLESLDLSFTNLLGHIPDSIGNLHNLYFLKLSNTNLSGYIPNSIGNLHNLTHLDLSSNNLSVSAGWIPSSVGKLVKLKYLGLSDISLSGSIPQSLFALPNLEELYLYFNMLSGEFRMEESSVGFSPLTILSLGYNQLTGSIPRAIYKLSNLENLDLSGNQFSGPIPISIFGLSNLEYLYLDSNNFNGTVKLSVLRHLPNLTVLYLSHNQLSVEDVSDEDLRLSFPSVSSFGLASCNLRQIPRLLSYHDGLDDVDLSKNHLHGVIPSWIWERFSSFGFPSLDRAFPTGHSLNMSYNEFTSVEHISICPSHPSCSMFLTIDFSSNKIKGHIPLIGARSLDYSNNEFSKIPSNYTHYLHMTRYLLLSANKLTGEVPTSFSEIPYLQVLDLSRNNLRGIIPSCIFEAPKLQILILSENGFHGIVHHIQKPCQLLVLDLSNNNLDGELLRSMTRCTSLLSLNIQNNRILDNFPFWLGEIPNLQVLNLKSNRLYGTLEPPSILASNNSLFPKLRLLGLASNNFQGGLPPSLFLNLRCMGNLSLYEITANEFIENIENAYNDYGISIIDKGIEMVLKTISASLMVDIDLSNNKFSGDIPEMIGNLSALTALNLSHNSFTGCIPHSFKGLNRIESLDLSWNELSGEIPEELTSLDSLSTINLSFNNLEGRIPQSTQFSTFVNSSFEGNPGLCGVPLSQQCEAANPGGNSTFPSANFANNISATVLLCLFAGLGFGTGFAIVILYPVIRRAKHRPTTR